MQKQQIGSTPGLLPKRQDFSFLTKLNTLFTIDCGNPSTILQVIGASQSQGPKYVKKTILLDEQNLQYAYTQRTMMQIINSEYVLKLLHWEEVKEKKVTRSRVGKEVVKQEVEVPKRLALYMDYCERGDLRTYLSETNPSIQRRVELFVEVLYAMRFLHQKFIIHRDMKLQNIFVTKDQKIKIADLGYASQTISVAQTPVGTFAYQAPEVYLKQEGGYNDKADVWSVGYLGFQILNKPLGEEIGAEIFIRDPFMPFDLLKKKVAGFQGDIKEQYLKIFEQNPLVFVPQIPNALKFLIGDMLVPYPSKRISFKDIYQGKYLTDLRKQLIDRKDLGQEKVNQMKTLHSLIDEYPKVYTSLKQKQKRMRKHDELYEYLYHKLYDPLSSLIYPDDILKPITGEQSNSMNILLFLTMRKMKMIYQELKGEDFFVLKKKFQQSDKKISGKYVQVKNSVEAYLRGRGEKSVDENGELISEEYFIRLMKKHAKAIGVGSSIME